VTHLADTFRSAQSPGVLHVVDMPGAGWDALAAAARCAREIGGDQRLLLLGDRHAAADAAVFGLAPTRTAAPPLRRLDAAVGTLDRAVAQLHREAPIGLIQVWSDSARILCRETFAYEFPINQEDPGPFVAGATTAASSSREALRAELGIAPHEIAILMATDRPGIGDARRFAGLIGVFHLADFPAVGIASSRTDNYRRAARFLRGFHRAWDVIPVSSPPLTLVAAADIVFYDQGDTLTADGGPGVATGGAAYAAAAMGLPVFAVNSPVARRLLAPLGGEAIAANGLLPELARVAVPLCQSAACRRDAGERLRAYAPSVVAGAAELAARWRTTAATTEAAA
jgi:hypothetical protein